MAFATHAVKCMFSRLSQALAPRQVIDPHTHQYLDRLRDEPLFLALAQKVSDYLGRVCDARGLARCALRRVEHFYHKTDAVYETMRRLAVAQHEAANLVQVWPQMIAQHVVDSWVAVLD